MDGKFTAGPWSVPHFARPEVNCECGYVLCDDHMGAVATVHCSGEGNDWERHGDNPKFEQAVANAHLIAAAPDLYEALRGMFDLVCVLQFENDAGQPPILKDGILDQKMRATRAALSKALGEPSTPPVPGRSD